MAERDNQKLTPEQWEQGVTTLRDRAARGEPVADVDRAKVFSDLLSVYPLRDGASLDGAREQQSLLAKNLYENIDLLINGEKPKELIPAVFSDLTDKRAGAVLLTSMFDEMHNQPPDKRFQLLSVISPAGEANMIAQCGDYMYTSTYKGIIEDYLKRLDQAGMSLADPQAGLTDPCRLGAFLDAAATFNRLDGKKGGDKGVLDYVPQKQWPGIVSTLFDRVATDANPKDASYTMVKILASQALPPDQRQAMERLIKDRYEKADAQAKNATDPGEKNKAETEKNKFGIIASAYGTYVPQAGQGGNKQFFSDIKSDERYKMPDSRALEKDRLQLSTPASGAAPKVPANYQLMLFPSVELEKSNNNFDHDSMSSYYHWIAQYEKKPGWKVESKDGYVHIYGAGQGKDGVAVHIFAADPRQSDKGLAAIKERVAKEQGAAPGQQPAFQVVVNRGHSIYTGGHVQWIDHNTSLVVLGSCGDHRKEDAVLKKSPHAQIVSTQGVGEKKVNDPVLFGINQEIRKHGRVDWAKIAQRIAEDPKIPVGKSDYVFPPADIGQGMIGQRSELVSPSPRQLPKKGASLRNHLRSIASQDVAVAPEAKPGETKPPHVAQNVSKHRSLAAVV
jgi:hypothetical protein